METLVFGWCVKLTTLKRIEELIREHGALSSQELMDKTGLCKRAITKSLRKLLYDKIIDYTRDLRRDARKRIYFIREDRDGHQLAEETIEIYGEI